MNYLTVLIAALSSFTFSMSASAEEVYYCVPDGAVFMSLEGGEFRLDERRTIALKDRFTFSFVQDSREPNWQAVKMSSRRDEIPCFSDLSDEPEYIDCELHGARFAFRSDSKTFVYRGDRTGLITAPYAPKNGEDFTFEEWNNSLGLTAVFMSFGTCETF